VWKDFDDGRHDDQMEIKIALWTASGPQLNERTSYILLVLNLSIFLDLTRLVRMPSIVVCLLL